MPGMDQTVDCRVRGQTLPHIELAKFPGIAGMTKGGSNALEKVDGAASGKFEGNDARDRGNEMPDSIGSVQQPSLIHDFPKPLELSCGKLPLSHAAPSLSVAEDMMKDGIPTDIGAPYREAESPAQWCVPFGESNCTVCDQR